MANHFRGITFLLQPVCFMLKMSYAGLSKVIYAQFTVKLGVAVFAAQNRENHKKFAFEFQGHSRSSMLVPLESSSAVLFAVSRKTVNLQPFLR